MRWLIATSFLLLFAIVLDAQVKGTVTSYSDGVPLTGVSIAVKGTSIGTITDIDGQYDINAGANDILVFTYLGFTSIEESINGRSIIDAALKEDVKTLEEVIVTGYGTQIKRELTGNIAKIKAADFKDIPVSSLEGVLQGKAAGVQINAGTGKLGQAMQIRIRGNSSVSASNEPLYVVDGIPITTANLSSNGGGATNSIVDINPQDIESIEILKDASAAAI